MKRQRRLYEQAALVAVRETRQIGLYWTRRGRKSTTLGSIAFDEMSKEHGRTVIAASASLLTGKELTSVTLSAVEQAMIVLNEAAAQRAVFETGAADHKLNFVVADSAKDKPLKGLTAEDFADLYQSSRMELRLYFDNTHFSRQLVIAPNPATARGWRGLVLRDECGFTAANLENELRVATDPMMRDTPDLKIVYASNLSSDDRHPWFETTMPREITAGTEEEQFPAQAAGHFYRGQNGMLIHRVALKDAYAAGHALFDDAGQPMTYDQCRVFPQFRMGWDESYALNHKPGGAAAIDLVALLTAQRRGLGHCAFILIDEDIQFPHEYSLAKDHPEFRRALQLLSELLTDGPVGIGFDVASTTNESSNPSSITVMEKVGGDDVQRLVLVFKQRKRKIMSGRLAEIVKCVRARPAGGPARRLCIDSSNEMLAAEETKDDLSHLIPVELVRGNNNVEPRPPGYTDEINYKTYQGDLYCASINDGRAVLPHDHYLKSDHRLLRKDQGRYLCDVGEGGQHGDTIDSGKQARWALISASGAFNAETIAGLRSGGNSQQPVVARPRFTPGRLA